MLQNLSQDNANNSSSFYLTSTMKFNTQSITNVISFIINRASLTLSEVSFMDDTNRPKWTRNLLLL